jgi:quercetin dioxygenase-like cupin family protein
MNKVYIRTGWRVIILLLILSSINSTHAQHSKRESNPELTLLAGDIHGNGHFAFRQKLPSGFSSGPHFYTSDYHITVLSGRIYIGYGKKVNRPGAKAFEAGTFFTIPAMQNHYEWTDEETVLQVYGTGPAETEYKKLSKGTNEVLKHDVYDTPVEMTRGQKIVQVHGDIKNEGLYCLRLRIAAGTTYAPHRHPYDQYVTVLKGALIIGYGKSVDATRMDTVEVGGFLCINERKIHYEVFPGETIVQIHGPGPLQSEFIKPGDK